MDVNEEVKFLSSQNSKKKTFFSGWGGGSGVGGIGVDVNEEVKFL